MKTKLETNFDKYVPPVMLWMLKNTKILVPMVDINMIMACCSLLQGVLTPEKFDVLEYWFCFCLTYACGFCLTEVDGVDYRKAFSNWWKGEAKSIKYPAKGAIFDYFVKEAKMEEWSTEVVEIDYSSDLPMGDFTVPTSETVAVTFTMETLIRTSHALLLLLLSLSLLLLLLSLL